MDATPAADPTSKPAVATNGVLSPGTLDDSLELLRTLTASAACTVQMAALEWQLFTRGMRRLLWLLPLILLLVLSLWATLLFGSYNLLKSWTGSTGWANLGVLVLQLLVLTGGAVLLNGVLKHALFARTRAALAGFLPADKTAVGSDHAVQ